MKKLSFVRLLRYTAPIMEGEDVRAWQRYLGIVDDGKFGPHTERVTKRMQTSLGLVPDGVVGPATIAAANADDETTISDIPPPPSGPITDRIVLADIPSVVSLVSKFRQAAKYTAANRKLGDIKHIVLHTAEVAENPESAEALMNTCATWDRDASWHFAVDNNSITQSVLVKDVAWHAPGANKTGIGIEMAGRARQKEEDWADAYSVDMLARCASLVAALCFEQDIQPVFVEVNDLRLGKSGITTHNIVSQAFKKSDHWDPGPHFPIDSFLRAVRQHLGY